MMAKIRKMSALGRLSGKIGELVIRNTKGGNQIVTQRQVKSEKPRSPKQLANQKRFDLATWHAKRTCRDRPEDWKVYQRLAEGTDRSAHNIAISDYMKPPVIGDIDVSGYRGRKDDIIRITAKDNVKVARVMVRLLRHKGEEGMEGKSANQRLIEGGAAKPTKEDEIWCYTVRGDVQCKVEVEVRAWDLARNEVVETKDMPTA